MACSFVDLTCTSSLGDTYTYASAKRVIIGSGNGLSNTQRQTITWNNADLLSVAPGTRIGSQGRCWVPGCTLGTKHHSSNLSPLQWSFGVLLWELLTRGCSPYADIDSFRIKTYLQKGYRLSQPEHAPDEVWVPTGMDHFLSSFLKSPQLIWRSRTLRLY